MKSITLTQTGKTPDFTTKLSPQIRLNPNKKYEAALLSINLFNSIPNITEINNIFKYSIDNGVNWKIITLDKGSYQLSTINDEIQRHMVINGDYDTTNNSFYISITPITSGYSFIEITNQTYVVDFNIENSIGSTLGFHNKRISYGYNKSDDIVKIITTNRIYVNIDIISGSYSEGIQGCAIYSFNPNKVSPGYMLIETPNPKLIYYSVNKSDINKIRIWLTNEDNDIIDLNSEEVTVSIHIREVINMEKQIINAIKKVIKEENIL